MSVYKAIIWSVSMIAFMAGSAAIIIYTNLAVYSGIMLLLFAHNLAFHARK